MSCRYLSAEDDERVTVPCLYISAEADERVTMPCLYISAEGDQEVPKIKKAGGVSRFLDAIFYRNSIAEN